MVLFSSNVRLVPPVPIAIPAFSAACPWKLKSKHQTFTFPPPEKTLIWFLLWVMRIVTTRISMRCGNILLISSAQSITVISSALKPFVSTAAPVRSGLIDSPTWQGIAIGCWVVGGLSGPLCGVWCAGSLGECRSQISERLSAGNLLSECCLIEMCTPSAYQSAQFHVRYWFVVIGHSPFLKLYGSCHFKCIGNIRSMRFLREDFSSKTDWTVLKTSFPLSKSGIDCNI